MGFNLPFLLIKEYDAMEEKITITETEIEVEMILFRIDFKNVDFVKTSFMFSNIQFFGKKYGLVNISWYDLNELIKRRYKGKI